MRSQLKNLLLPIIAVALIGCHSDNDPAPVTPVADPEPTQNIVEVARAAGSFTTLEAALAATGADMVLSDENATFTVFAPTDAAFAKLGDEAIADLLADPEALLEILLYHVIADVEIGSAAAIAAAGTTVATANGESVGISLDGTTLRVNLATVTDTDIAASNGVIHVIDTVLLPPAEPGEPTANIVETAVLAGSFTTLVTALQTAGLDALLTDAEETFTVFAPTDAAFAALGDEAIVALLADADALSATLLRHVLPGAAVNSVTAFSLAGTTVASAGEEQVALTIDDGQLLVNNAAITTYDIYTTNGIIHVIDAVISGGGAASGDNIVEVARNAGSFTTLVAALEATGADMVLSDPEATFTVFAPNDAAFAKLGDEAIADLLADPDTLLDILLYHVIAEAEVNAAAAIAAAGTTVAMANGDSVGVSLQGSDLRVNLATVIDVDIAASNGLIHVLDTVLIPPTEPGSPTDNIVQTAINAGSFGTLVTALQTAELDTVLADPESTYTVFAPTDEAFAALGQETIDALLADVEALTEVLLRHVIADAAVNSVSAFSLAGMEVSTAGDELVELSIEDGQLFINNAAVVTYDIYTSNGIIHVLDAVIMSEM